MDYLRLLEDSYKKYKTEGGSRSKLEFLSGQIFGFVTYESLVATTMAKRALEVCVAIRDHTTFDYINEEENNLWYLVMVNMPFFESKIDWGTSIRGAWWDIYGDKTFTIDLYEFEVGGESLDRLDLDKGQWSIFIGDMVEFCK